jgi:hypothetical protein
MTNAKNLDNRAFFVSSPLITPNSLTKVCTG